MSNIRVDLGYPITSGQGVIFKAPVNCSDITGLIVYYPQDGETVSSVFDFADAHGNNVGGLNLFAEGALVKVLLDTELYRAYVQNPDTNEYLEGEFKKRLLAIESDEHPGCYYKPVSDSEEVEWINPPIHPTALSNGEKEFRTCERFLGNPVYVSTHSYTFTPQKNTYGISLPVGAENIRIEFLQRTGIRVKDASSLFSETFVSNISGVHFTVSVLDSGGIPNGGINALMIVKYTKAS